MQHSTPAVVAQNQRRAGSPRPLWKAWAATVLAVLVMLFCSMAARTAEDAPEDTSQKLMKVSEVRRGMRGYGLSTFKDAQVQKFDVEVLGVMRGWSPQGSVVLVRMSGPVVDEAGTVAGMSGSPIYIDGKLLGAVAYGFYFSKIPLAGVTPIEEMLVAADIDRQGGSSNRAAHKMASRRRLRRESLAVLAAMRSGKVPYQKVLDEAMGRMVVPMWMQRRPASLPAAQMPAAVRALLENTRASAMAPLPTPLAVGGIGRGAFSTLAPMLASGGFVPVQAAASASGGAELKPVPGAPVGAVLISGDIDMSGMGTLTMIDGDQVLAFGHPMMGWGDSDFPLALGRVQAIVPSTQFSFRLTSAEKIIGRLTQDRSSAIVGRLGKPSPMFPCTVRVKGDRDTTFRYKVASFWRTAAFLSYYVTAASALRWEGSDGLFTVKGSCRIRIKGRARPIVLQNEYATFSPAWPAFELVWWPLEMLTLNDFQEVEVMGVDVELEVTKGLRAARIDSVRISHREVEPGGRIELLVKLVEFQGGEHVRKITLEVPRDAQPGTQVRVLVCDAMASRMMDMGRDPGFWQPRDMEGLIAAVERTRPNTHMFAHASFQKRGLRYEGVPMPQLPSSVLNILTAGTETGMTAPLMDGVETHVETPWVIVGMGEAVVAIKEPAAEASNRY